MRYVAARIQRDDETYIRDIYSTDALKAIVGNIADVFGGTDLDLRYYDLIRPQAKEIDGEEIKDRIKKKLKEEGNK